MVGFQIRTLAGNVSYFSSLCGRKRQPPFRYVPARSMQQLPAPTFGTFLSITVPLANDSHQSTDCIPVLLAKEGHTITLQYTG